jgi:hypothetical protein
VACPEKKQCLQVRIVRSRNTAKKRGCKGRRGYGTVSQNVSREGVMWNGGEMREWNESEKKPMKSFYLTHFQKSRCNCSCDIADIRYHSLVYLWSLV